jgi:hypothetical protein
MFCELLECPLNTRSDQKNNNRNELNLILLFTEKIFAAVRIGFELLLNGGCDGRNEVERVQVQIVAKNFGKLNNEIYS